MQYKNKNKNKKVLKRIEQIGSDKGWAGGEIESEWEWEKRVSCGLKWGVAVSIVCELKILGFITINEGVLVF